MRKIAILGLGYVGLPIACQLAKRGFQVVGIDIIKEKINLTLIPMDWNIEIEV